VERREFLRRSEWRAVSPPSDVSTRATAAATPPPAPAGGSAPLAGPESRKAWGELIALLADADTRYLGKEWGIERAGDVSDGHRFLAHVLRSGWSSGSRPIRSARAWCAS